MGIRFSCPNGHKLNVKTFLAGKRAICPDCGAKVIVPNLREQVTAPSFADGPGIAAIGRSMSQLMAEADAPSIAITLVENDLPGAAHSEAPAVSISEALPDSIIAATTPSAAVAAHVAATPESNYDPARERTRRNQMLMAVALLFVVVVLAGVLIWVLKRGVTQAPSTEPAPVKTTRTFPNRLDVLTQAKV